MPKIPEIRLVRCAFCGRVQPDRGIRNTCESCGASPTPSYSYPKDSGFYPKGVETQQGRIERLVAQRRGM
jgi:hypothetical protein